MSATVGTIAGTTGIGTERQVVWASNSGNWWAFQFTSTNVISSWYSADGSSWSAGATVTIGAAHSSEGRDLMVAYKSISGIDTVWLCYVETPTTVYAVKARRATISGTTITYHSSETTLSQNNISGALTTPRYSGGGWEIASDNKIHCVNGALDPNQDITWTGTSSADPGTAEQATPPSWGLQTVVDNSQSNVVKSGMTFAMTNGDLAHLGDDGSADATLTAVILYTLPSGGSWSQVGSATGTISAIDKNDWGAVLRTTSDIHLVYRNSSGSLIHRRYNGSSWSAGQTIPAQNNLAGGGVALTSDGVSVWLGIIDTDGANTVRYIQWISGDYTGHGDAWDTAWSVVEGSVATRTQLGVARDTDGSYHALFYWTEGSSMVAAAVDAIFPPDPPGLANRDAISALGTAASASTLAIAFTGTQPPKGDKIIVGFWASWGGAAPSITSVKDNGAVQNTFTSSANSVGSAQGCWIYWLDMPPTTTWSGNYTVTVTFSASVNEADGGAIAYSNMQAGAPTATNNNTSTSATATPGAVNPPATPATYFVVVTDATGSNPATFTFPAPYLRQVAQTNGSTQQAGALGDALNNSGNLNPSITIDSSLWNAAQAAFPGAPVTYPTFNIRPGPTWRRQFQLGIRHPQPAAVPGTTTQNLQQALSGGLSFTGSQVRAISKGLSGSLSFTGALARSVGHLLSATLSFTGSQVRSVSHLLSATLSFTGSQARSVGKGLSGALSFTGSQLRAMTKGLTGTLSFTGSQTRAIVKGTFSATLSFTGSLASGKQFQRALSASLSFTGSQVRSTGKALSGSLSFTGSQLRAVTKGMSAALSFTGSQVRTTAKRLTGATLSFTGSVTSSQVFLKALSGTLSFSGSQARVVGKSLSGSLSFAGTQARSIRKAMSAALSFAGSVSASSTAVIQSIAVTIVTRSMQLRVVTRDMVATVPTRALRGLIWSRDMAVRIFTRSGKTSTR